MTGSKKIILVIVEGDTEETIFSMALQNLVSEMSLREKYKVIVAKPYFAEQDKYGGDITSYYGPERNIFDVLRKTVLEPTAKREHFLPEDIAQIIQIVDLDAINIPDTKCRQGNENGGAYYVCTEKESYILAGNREKLIETRNRKRKNLKALSNCRTVQFGDTCIPYEVYYFSCNLDHYWTNMLNLSDRQKSDYATRFLEEYINSSDRNMTFLSHFNLEGTSGRTYRQTWDTVKKNDVLIRRETNFDLCLAAIMSDFETEHKMQEERGTEAKSQNTKIEKEEPRIHQGLTFVKTNEKEIEQLIKDIAD